MREGDNSPVPASRKWSPGFAERFFRQRCFSFFWAREAAERRVEPSFSRRFVACSDVPVREVAVVVLLR